MDHNKDLQINQILQIIKLVSLSFSAIAFFQYYFEGKKIDVVSGVNDFIVCLVLTIILMVYVFWNYLQSKKKDHPSISAWVDPLIFLTIFTLCIMVTGNYQSNYKFLFLFIIVSSGIECTMKTAVTISAVSSFIILAIDLLFAPRTPSNIHFESDLVLSCVFVIIAWTIGFYVRLEHKHIDSLKELANMDGLTGLYNHRYFYERLSKSIGQCRTDGTNLALLFIDVDSFKIYNDINGHQQGDKVLRSISDILKSNARENDFISRYGGEEFAIILPSTTEQEALKIAERLRLATEKQHFEGQEYMPNQNLTISIGIAAFPTMAKSETELVKFADEALYRAKFLKKNNVEIYASVLDDLQNSINENDKEIIASIKTLIAVINAKDKYTFKHVERVVSYSLLMADQLKFDEHTKRIFIYAAYMHDIGKINISQEILNKSTPLTEEEWEILQSHPKNGAEIIKNVVALKEVVPIILQHHERYDGTGYPDKLKGNEISYLARLLTVIDSFDAMTSNRPYQKKKTFSEAFDELVRCSGTQFDPELAQEFIRVIRDSLNHI